MTAAAITASSVSCPIAAGCGVEPGTSRSRRSDADKDAPSRHEDEQERCDLSVDTGELGRLGIAAQGEHRPAEAGAGCDEVNGDALLAMRIITGLAMPSERPSGAVGVGDSQPTPRTAPHSDARRVRCPPTAGEPGSRRSACDAGSKLRSA